MHGPAREVLQHLKALSAPGRSAVCTSARPEVSFGRVSEHVDMSKDKVGPEDY